jgi:hypothetical protein
LRRLVAPVAPVGGWGRGADRHESFVVPASGTDRWKAHWITHRCKLFLHDRFLNQMLEKLWLHVNVGVGEIEAG